MNECANVLLPAVTQYSRRIWSSLLSLSFPLHHTPPIIIRKKKTDEHFFYAFICLVYMKRINWRWRRIYSGAQTIKTLYIMNGKKNICLCTQNTPKRKKTNTPEWIEKKSSTISSCTTISVKFFFLVFLFFIFLTDDYLCKSMLSIQPK